MQLERIKDVYKFPQLYGQSGSFHRPSIAYTYFSILSTNTAQHFQSMRSSQLEKNEKLEGIT